MSKQLGTRISDELHARLVKIARREGTTVSKLVDEALRKLAREYERRADN